MAKSPADFDPEIEHRPEEVLVINVG